MPPANPAASPETVRLAGFAAVALPVDACSVPFTLSQLPPLAALGWAVHFRVPALPLRMSTTSAGGFVPPSTTEKLRPVREIRIFGSALNVIVTGMRALCPATSAAMSISPEYVPATPPAAFGVTFDGSAVAVHGTGAALVKAVWLQITDSHPPPDAVEADGVTFSVPPPWLDSDRVCVWAAGPCTKE